MKSGTGPRAGILGGGQLSLMLLEGAARLGIQPVILADRLDDPAVGAAGGVETSLAPFLACCDLVAFENEFVDCAALSREAKGQSFIPALDVIGRLSDKLEQKKLFEELALPSAPYEAWDGGLIAPWFARLIRRFGGRFVLKWAKYGYDGKGCFFIQSESDLAKAEVFVAAAVKRGTTVYAEKAMSFSRELAQVACLSVTGDFVAYPLVISTQTRGICKWIEGPALELGVPRALAEQARAAAQKLASRLAVNAGAFAGTFALEFFETDEGLMLNEIAPRVHNSGHFSIEACPASQFENHWRALLGLPMGGAESKEFFCMLNLLGPEKIRREVEPGKAPKRAVSHWYGKKGFKPGRKLGHVTGLAPTARELAALKEELGKYDEDWQKECAKA